MQNGRGIAELRPVPDQESVLHRLLLSWIRLAVVHEADGVLGDVRAQLHATLRDLLFALRQPYVPGLRSNPQWRPERMQTQQEPGDGEKPADILEQCERMLQDEAWRMLNSEEHPGCSPGGWLSKRTHNYYNDEY